MIFDDQAARLDRQWRELHGLIIDREDRMANQIQHTEFSIGDFVGWQSHGILKLNPNFQRRPVWKKGAKSYLIDTIVRGISMPIIFLRRLPVDLKTLQSQHEVVDGQQRLRTVFSYINPELLSDYRADRDEFKIDSVHNEELGGKSFPQLSKDVKQQILDYQLSVHVFPADTADGDILQVFARMNATGMKLNYQELRNAEWFGKFKTAAYELASEQLYRWRDSWRVFTPDQIARMDEVEFASEFMLLIMEGVLEKDKSTIDAFYRDFDESFPDEREVISRFRSTMDKIEELFSTKDIERLFRNRTMFYALFVAVHGLMFGLRSPAHAKKPAKGELSRRHVLLTKQSPKSISADIVNSILRGAEEIRSREAHEDVLRATRGSTAHASSRRVVIGHLTGTNDPCPPLR
jgi:hypothetical protein